MTHYCNEYYDLDSDRINNSENGWTGGSKVLVNEGFKPNTALYTAIFLAFFGILMQFLIPFFVPEFIQGRKIALIMLIWAWEYSAPPLKLHSRCLGEITVAGIVTGLTPIYGALLQMTTVETKKQWSYHELILTLIPLILTQFTRMIVMNIPDLKGD